VTCLRQTTAWQARRRGKAESRGCGMFDVKESDPAKADGVI